MQYPHKIPSLWGFSYGDSMAKRKMTEAQLANLQTDKYKFSKDNPEIAQKCQKLSVEKRKENQSLAELLKIGLTLPNEESGEINNIAMTNALINKAIKGDVSAYITIRDTIGEKPTDKQQISGNVKVLPTTLEILPVKGKDEI